MADDETLQKTAVRIKSRAIKRCGELLKQFDARGDHRQMPDAKGAPPILPSRGGRPTKPECLNDQIKDAVRVSNVPEAEFERLVESDDPPSITQLAELGKSSRPEPPPEPPKPEGFAQATQFIGQIRELAAFCRANPPGRILSGMADDGGEPLLTPSKPRLVGDGAEVPFGERTAMKKRPPIRRPQCCDCGDIEAAEMAASNAKEPSSGRVPSLR